NAPCWLALRKTDHEIREGPRLPSVVYPCMPRNSPGGCRRYWLYPIASIRVPSARNPARQNCQVSPLRTQDPVNSILEAESNPSPWDIPGNSSRSSDWNGGHGRTACRSTARPLARSTLCFHDDAIHDAMLDSAH